MIRAALLVALAGCAPVQTVGPFVRDVHFDGDELVVERCRIEFQDEKMRLGLCTLERHRLPGIDEVDIPPCPPGAPVELNPNSRDELAAPPAPTPP